MLPGRMGLSPADLMAQKSMFLKSQLDAAQEKRLQQQASYGARELE